MSYLAEQAARGQFDKDALVCWQTRDGREIPVKDMETGHIRNTVRMLAEKLEAESEELDFCYRNFGEPSKLDLAMCALAREWLRVFGKELKRRGEQCNDSQA